MYNSDNVQSNVTLMVCCIMSCLDNFGQTEFWLNLEGAGSMMDVFTGISRNTTSTRCFPDILNKLVIFQQLDMHCHYLLTIGYRNVHLYLQMVCECNRHIILYLMNLIYNVLLPHIHTHFVVTKV